jgi:SM-20-related protein
MSPRAPLSAVQENLIDDERLLSRAEREFLSTLLRQANNAPNNSPELKNAVLQTIERAVGETVAQRAYGLLGGGIVRKLLEEEFSSSRLSGLTVPDSRGDLQRVVSMGPQPPTSGPHPPAFDEPAARARATSIPPHGDPQPPSFDEPRSKVSMGPHPPKGGQPQTPGFEEPAARARATSIPPHGDPQPPSFDEPRSKVSMGPHPPKGGQPQTPGFEEPAARARLTSIPPHGDPQPPSFDEPRKRVSMVPHPPGGDPQPPSFDEPVDVHREHAALAVMEAPKTEFRSAQCLVLDEFLVPEELDALTRYALEKEKEFKFSEVVAPGLQKGLIDFEHRRSRVLIDLHEHQDVIVNRIESSLPRILDKLDLEPFEISSVEAQITASNDGDFFRQHADDGQDKVASRQLTFVYFFHREPKAFTGGELRIYDSVWQDGRYCATENYRVVKPEQNQIVLFPSCLVHEITPIEIPSKAFMDSRFTVNGWFRR